MKRFLRRMRSAIGRWTGRVPRVRTDLRVETVRLGSEYGGWVIAPTALPPGAVIYSAGVGADVSFDAELLANWKPAVLRLIDPTPGILEHPRVASLRSDSCRVTRHAVALGSAGGTIELWPPAREDHVSYSEVNVTDRRPIQVPARTLSMLMDELGDARIDLLKMDIEGAEYGVIDDLLRSDIRPSQLLIEFHHRFPAIGPERTKESIARLRRAGFRLFAVSPTAEEYSFLHIAALVGEHE